MNCKPFLYFILASSIFFACTPSNEELLDKAYKLGKQQKYDEAIKIYAQIISRNNQIQLAYYNRGIDYLAQKSYQQAFNDFNRVLSLQTVGDFHIRYNENPITP